MRPIVLRVALTLATALILTAPVGPFHPTAAQAQSSFGGQRSVQTRAEWERETDRAPGLALRRANSALASAGTARSVGMVVRLDIGRDGTLRDVALLQGSGRPSLDASLIRALSRDLGIPPFTPDMPEAVQSVTLQIGTVRQ
ncbi:TonB C-terminal domain-containing protein [Paracoccus sp. ME4]|uniref:TonB C-terminal domain-containing protein n=1 Tax=Paracoccus sp. ME4 TaxID=3138066 RepID=UPI00398AC26D